MLHEQMFKTFNHYRSEGYRAEIREAGGISFFGDRNDGGTFEAGGHHSLSERVVKDVCENIL